MRRCKDLREIRRNIDSNTICIVGSAPDYPFGLIDPIKELSELAKSYKVNFHIDACMGGFLLPFTENFSYINFNLKGIKIVILLKQYLELAAVILKTFIENIYP